MCALHHLVVAVCCVQLSFTRSLSNQLVSKGIRVNAVAPGPIWTPLIASTFDEVGSDTRTQRQIQPLLAAASNCCVLTAPHGCKCRSTEFAFEGEQPANQPS